MFYEAFYRALPACIAVNLKYQVVIGIYKADFVFGRFVIEIDGHEFHKTKEQREHDYNRERYLQRRSFFIVRFTGTEIFQNADKCVQEFLEIGAAYVKGLENSPLVSEMLEKRLGEKQ